MPPYRRLLLLAQDLEGELKVERSYKWASAWDDRFLLMVPTTVRNAALIDSFAKRVGVSTTEFNAWIPSSDHLGVCVSKSQSVRLYTQHLNIPDPILYRGFKVFSDGSTRVDEYRQQHVDASWHTRLGLNEMPDEGHRKTAAQIIHRVKGAAESPTITSIASQNRDSWLIQFESEGLSLLDFELSHLGTTLDELSGHKLNHLAGGGDARDASFLNFYFQSSIEELHYIARKR